MGVTVRDVIKDLERLREHWDEAPFVSTDNADISAVFGVEAVEHLISDVALPVSAIRLIKDGVNVRRELYARRRELEGRDRERLVDPAAVQTAIAAGNTLVLEELQTYCPGVAELARATTAETGFSTYCGAFVTPAGARGLPPHYDLVGTLIRQVHGSKRWQVSEPFDRHPTRKWEQATHLPTRLVLDSVLYPGDCLYVPRGWVHVGDATDEASIHLTVGLKPYPWMVILGDLLQQTLAADEFRDSLPYAFHHLGRDELVELLMQRAEQAADRFAEVARRMNAGDLLDQIGRSYQSRSLPFGRSGHSGDDRLQDWLVDALAGAESPR